MWCSAIFIFWASLVVDHCFLEIGYCQFEISLDYFKLAVT